MTSQYMAGDEQLDPLQVADTDFLVASAIERCPSTMMPRELIMNAIEAAHQDTSGKGEIWILSKKLHQFPGISKLAIWNNGPGMSDTDLLHIGNIAASLKPLALDKNFGMGAKVASLNINHFGLRYRSCNNGIVHQIVLGKINGRFGFLKQPLADGSLEKVIDVTQAVKAEGEYPLDKSWTEVTLLGNSAEQDTVFDPYGDGKTPKQWLHDAMYHRFYRVPENVTIQFHEETHTRNSDRKFKTIPQRLNFYGKYETVKTLSGVKITYIHDPARENSSHNISINGAISSTPAHTAIVFKNEMYDVRKANSWASIAPEFGVSFGSRHVVIHIEIPDDFGVVPEGYRRFLQLDGGDQHQLEVREFANLVRENMPDWLAEIIRGYGPRPSTESNAIEQELQKLLDQLSIITKGLRQQDDGDKTVSEGTGRGEAPLRGNTIDPNPNPQPGKNTFPKRYQETVSGTQKAIHAQTRETAPRVHYLDDEETIAERNLVNRSARYVQLSNELYINCKYDAIEQITEHLYKHYSGFVVSLGDVVREKARAMAISIVATKVGRGVVFAKAKLNAHAWTAEDVDHACTPECLSIVADDWNDVAGEAVNEMRKSLGISTRQVKEARAA
jgi:hypothetical protein